jgi:hypothetical protein
VKSLDRILADIDSPVDLVKFDIEGNEYDVFSHSQLVHGVSYIIGEIKASQESLKHFLSLFPHHKSFVNHLTSKMHIIFLKRE